MKQRKATWDPMGTVSCHYPNYYVDGTDRTEYYRALTWDRAVQVARDHDQDCIVDVLNRWHEEL